VYQKLQQEIIQNVTPICAVVSYTIKKTRRLLGAVIFIRSGMVL
jgi:hypothetical protein